MYKNHDTGAWTPNGLFFATPMGYNLWGATYGTGAPKRGAPGPGHGVQPMGARTGKFGGAKGCNLWGATHGGANLEIWRHTREVF